MIRKSPRYNMIRLVVEKSNNQGPTDITPRSRKYQLWTYFHRLESRGLSFLPFVQLTSLHRLVSVSISFIIWGDLHPHSREGSYILQFVYQVPETLGSYDLWQESFSFFLLAVSFLTVNNVVRVRHKRWGVQKRWPEPEFTSA